MNKKPSDVRGYQMRCPDYEKCPLCYGCRNYDDQYIKCRINCGNDTGNVCNTKRHQAHLIAKMLTREKVILE